MSIIPSAANGRSVFLARGKAGCKSFFRPYVFCGTLDFVVCAMRLLPCWSVAQIFTPITNPARSHCILSICFNKRMGCLLGG